MQESSFVLGVASGVVLLPVAAYRRVSPPWLRWLLTGCGLLVAARYAAAADVLPAHVVWHMSPVGFALPAIFAVDHLVRHPALSPAKLLRWSAPAVAVYVASALLDWPWLLRGLEAAFVIGLVAVCGLLIRKLPVRRLRWSLGAVAMAYASLAVGGLLAECVVLWVLWLAYETTP